MASLPRLGKTEFLRKDLVPAAEQAGYITIYVSLWESREDPEAQGPGADVTDYVVSATIEAIKPTI